jgi:hypothetical protein
MNRMTVYIEVLQHTWKQPIDLWLYITYIFLKCQMVLKSMIWLAWALGSIRKPGILSLSLSILQPSESELNMEK